MLEVAFSILVVALTLACVVLVSLWSSTDMIGSLGMPSWDQNIFALHPIMLCGGFYPSLVLAVSLPIIVNARDGREKKKAIAKYTHISLQIISIIFLILGLYAIFEYKKFRNHLNIAHSWLGIITLIGLFCNFLSGVVKSFSNDKISPIFKAWHGNAH